MSIENKYLEMVGAYLDGELAADDAQAFEQEMQNNPELDRLIKDQKDIVEGIKSYRKQEIIARLDNLPIPSAGVSTGSLVKVASAVLIVGAVSFGVYQFIPQDPAESAVEESSLVEKQQDNSTNDAQVEVTSEPEGTETVSAPAVTNETPPKESDETEGQTTTVEEEDIASDVVMPAVPEPDMNLDDEGEDDLEMPTSSIGVVEVSETSTMEVEINSEGQYTFHYQVVNDRLVLYGNFSDEPYQIIEINVRQERQWYLYFKENYYSIEKQHAEITPLERLTNASLIEALNKRKDQDS